LKKSVAIERLFYLKVHAHRQLAKHRVSDNVGGVKQLLSTLQHALGEERHFALGAGVRSGDAASLSR